MDPSKYVPQICGGDKSGGDIVIKHIHQHAWIMQKGIPMDLFIKQPACVNEKSWRIWLFLDMIYCYAKGRSNLDPLSETMNTHKITKKVECSLGDNVNLVCLLWKLCKRPWHSYSLFFIPDIPYTLGDNVHLANHRCFWK